MIRLANTKDIKHILKITNACATHMISKGIYQWNNIYPNMQVFLEDINLGELYVYEMEKIIAGCIAITTVMDKEYKPVKWLTPNTNNVYIHRLA
ncbi:MAG: GNAT family N-acetyltransferase, partial [Bacteroidia bacterium]|nr:GNAT family N-acetyltransferase [Bacteroidia bacterium]